MDGLLAHESSVRYYLLLAGFAAVAIWEAMAPRLSLVTPLRRRWSLNIGLTVLVSVLCAVVFPVADVAFAVLVEHHGFGLLHVLDPGPAWSFAIGFLAVDLSRYLTHRVMHAVPWLWRVHRVHHSDPELDCTTALRFHPLEALVTVTIQLAAIAAVGAPPLAVLALELATALVALFSHANAALPDAVERWLRRVLITPGLHRIHHSVVVHESDTNYGTVLSAWDHLFRTCRQTAAEPLAHGVDAVPAARAHDLAFLLASPLRAQWYPTSRTLPRNT